MGFLTKKQKEVKPKKVEQVVEAPAKEEVREKIKIVSEFAFLDLKIEKLTEYTVSVNKYLQEIHTKIQELNEKVDKAMAD